LSPISELFDAAICNLFQVVDAAFFASRSYFSIRFCLMENAPTGSERFRGQAEVSRKATVRLLRLLQNCQEN
jgi:hypothetical protein